jgi:hypothetical protein
MTEALDKLLNSEKNLVKNTKVVHACNRSDSPKTTPHSMDSEDGVEIIDIDDDR